MNKCIKFAKMNPTELETELNQYFGDHPNEKVIGFSAYKNNAFNLAFLVTETLPTPPRKGRPPKKKE